VNYRPEIDGLRGIAVALVITFHAFPEFLSGGWIGVDVFFVISGFLITSLIVRGIKAQSFSFRNFYTRRLRRLAPAFLATLILTSVLGWLSLPPDKLDELGASGLAALTGWSNIYFWLNSDYFAEPATASPLIHTWSLALEEQFYLIFPIAVVILVRIKRVPLFGWITLALLVSFFFALDGGLGSNTVFYLLPTRAWELLAGALLALAPGRFQSTTGKKNHLWFLAGLVGLGAIIAGAFFVPDGDYKATYSILPVMGTLAALFASTRDTRFRALLAVYPLRKLGLISYSAYLIHQPLLVFARNLSVEGGTLIEMGSAVAVGLILAGLSYEFVEKPFRSPDTTPGVKFRNKISISVVTATLLLTGLSFSIFSERPWEWHSVAIPGYSAGAGNMRSESWEILRSRDARVDVTSNASELSGWFSTTDPRPALLLLGNSHSKDLYNTLHSSEKAAGHFQLGRVGVQIRELDSKSDVFSSESYKSASVVVIASRLGSEDVKNLEAVLLRLQADGKAAAVVLDIPDVRVHSPESWIFVDRLVWVHQDLWPHSTQISQQVNADFYSIVQGSPEAAAVRQARQISERLGAVILERRDYICEWDVESCFAVGPGLEKYFYDGSHHSLNGAEFFGARVDEIGWLDELH
jgi:peptidoglycan/LPS O-acetylase OafA/YrhL